MRARGEGDVHQTPMHFVGGGHRGEAIPVNKRVGDFLKRLQTENSKNTLRNSGGHVTVQTGATLGDGSESGAYHPIQIRVTL